jgi:hypothetical protein
MIDIDYCASSYCAFRYVVKPGVGWSTNRLPALPKEEQRKRVPVRSAGEILAHLRTVCSTVEKEGPIGLLLSGGIDSAILAALLPPTTPTFTIRFDAEGALDESSAAGRYARHLGLSNTVVVVSWTDYEKHIDGLMGRKNAPLHPVEVALYAAGLVASKNGVKTLVTGNGADSTFGGLDNLLSRDWSFGEFVERYTFLDPQRVLRRPQTMNDVFEPYRTKSGVDVVRFLKEVHGTGIVQMFENALGSAGCEIVSPYEDFALSAPLDLDRIRSGEPKYLLQDVFRLLYPDLDAPGKIAFARPVGTWLREWTGPKNDIFAESLDASQFTGEQRWQMYCLDRFLALG